jgi:hypothetical protein
MRRPLLKDSVAAPRLGLAMLAVLALAAFSPANSAADSHRWLGLDDGRIGDYLWSVKIKRPEGAAGSGNEGALRPCLLVGTKFEIGAFNYRRSRYRACADAANRLSPTGAPLIGTGVQEGAAAGLTAVGMVATPAVRRVVLSLAGGRQVVVPLDRLTPAQARSAQLSRLRYAAFAVRGTWCTERIVTLSRTGATLWDSGTDEYTCDSPG